MCTKALRKWALLLTFWVAVQFSRLHADQTVNGNLNVTGNSDLEGGTLTFGTRGDNSNPGAGVLYTDGASSSLEFDASRAANLWKWQQNGGATLQLQMSLSSSNALVLYDQSATPVAKITLNPLGASTFSNSLTVNGTDNEMPHQTLASGNSVLIERLADERYLLSAQGGSDGGPTSLVLGEGAGTVSAYSLAIGFEARTGEQNAPGGGMIYTNANDAVALGYQSTAMAQQSLAIGYQAFASGVGATALGQSSSASGQYAFATGHLSVASGISATAVGTSTTASGNNSVALGLNLNAQSVNDTAIGIYNVGGGDPQNWVATDPLFEIGNGVAPVVGGLETSYSGYYSSTYPTGSWSDPGNGQPFIIEVYQSGSGYYVTTESNVYVQPNTGISDALEVFKNGNTVVQGSLSASSLSTSGGLSVGSATSSGAVTAPAFVTTAPAGDIPMYTGN